MAISKRNLALRVAKAADAAPSLEDDRFNSLDDRFKHARDRAHAHPAPDTPREMDTPQPGAHLGDSKKAARLVQAPINLIDPNPYNARRIYRPERVSELAASIGSYGQDTPGIATMRNGRYVLASGHYRDRAIRVAGLPTMDLMVHEGLTDRELFAYSYRENVEREGQSALDNALCWRDLLDQGLYASETDLAEATGVSLPNVSKTLKLLELSASVLDVIRESPSAFAMSALYELVLYEAVAGQEAAMAMVLLLKSGDAGRKEVQEARARIEAPKARKQKETSRPYKIDRPGAYSGTLKVFGDSGRVLLDIVFVDPEAREAMLAEIKMRFGVAE